MSFEILNRWTGAQIFASETAQNIAEAVMDAIKRGADLRGANLSYADLRGADLRGANLSYADLRGANLSYADLSYADLRGADLSYANLRGADLRGANLSYANLSYADLSYADLRGADLRGANLSYADLSYANLRGADLRGANLSYADLSYANCNTAIGGTFLVLRGSRHALIATADAISIGCMRNTLDWWREHYAGVGRAEGYSAAEVEEYRQHIEYAAAWLAARKPAEVAA